MTTVIRGGFALLLLIFNIQVVPCSIIMSFMSSNSQLIMLFSNVSNVIVNKKNLFNYQARN